MSKLKKSQKSKRADHKDAMFKFYPIHLVVIDTGDFGYNACGRCGKEIKATLNVCPHCRAKLAGTYLPPYPGGSDF